ncbi:MAG: hypothetical protein QOH09_2058, partial [Pseudonocardiales bacterium]|nr:hypothetical protein [Pseudonocardiales bacterium]
PGPLTRRLSPGLIVTIRIRRVTLIRIRITRPIGSSGEHTPRLHSAHATPADPATCQTDDQGGLGPPDPPARTEGAPGAAHHGDDPGPVPLVDTSAAARTARLPRASRSGGTLNSPSMSRGAASKVPTPPRRRRPHSPDDPAAPELHRRVTDTIPEVASHGCGAGGLSFRSTAD